MNIPAQPLQVGDHGDDLLARLYLDSLTFQVIGDSLCLLHQFIIGDLVISCRIWNACAQT